VINKFIGIVSLALNIRVLQSFEVFENDGEPFVIYETDGMLQEPAPFISDSYDNYIAILNGTSAEYDNPTYMGNCGKIVALEARKSIKVLYFGKNFNTDSMAEYLTRILTNLGFSVSSAKWGRIECLQELGIDTDTILSRLTDYGICLIDCSYVTDLKTPNIDCIELPTDKCC
jgi:hypothetical protein